MNCYLDTEFTEGRQDKKFLGIKYGETKPTIDLISIGIKCDSGRTLYMVSKDFNFDAAWKDEWVRENVLQQIFGELSEKEPWDTNRFRFNRRNCKFLVNKYGSTNEEIKESILELIEGDEDVKLYGYYSDYDHVVLSQLFGRMVDLPSNMPMYTTDLKQMLDEVVDKLDMYYGAHIWNAPPSNTIVGLLSSLKNDRQEKDRRATFGEKISRIKELYDYPYNCQEHNALEDAIWNMSLHKFIEELSNKTSE